MAVKNDDLLIERQDDTGSRIISRYDDSFNDLWEQIFQISFQLARSVEGLWADICRVWMANWANTASFSHASQGDDQRVSLTFTEDGVTHSCHSRLLERKPLSLSF